MTKVHLQSLFAIRLEKNLCAGCGRVIEVMYFRRQGKRYCTNCNDRLEELEKAEKECNCSLEI